MSKLILTIHADGKEKKYIINAIKSGDQITITRQNLLVLRFKPNTQISTDNSSEKASLLKHQETETFITIAYGFQGTDCKEDNIVKENFAINTDIKTLELFYSDGYVSINENNQRIRRLLPNKEIQRIIEQPATYSDDTKVVSMYGTKVKENIENFRVALTQMYETQSNPLKTFKMNGEDPQSRPCCTLI